MRARRPGPLPAAGRLPRPGDLRPAEFHPVESLLHALESGVADRAA